MVSQQIIKQCIGNDRQAQASLYNTCAPYVYTVVKSYISDEDYIKDTMQESFAGVFKSLDKYDEQRGKFKSWIAQITIRKCIDHLKSNKKIVFSSPLEVVESFSDNDFEYLDQLSKNDISHLLRDMPSGYKTIFMLSIIDEYPHTEIAIMLDISKETSRSQLHRALKWIKNNIFQTAKLNRYETY